MITRLFLICALSLSAVPASADDPAQANRLLVEAAQLFRQANQATTPERLPLLESAFSKLNDIVRDHPSSDLAVQIITDQQIGSLSFGSLARSLCEEQIRAGQFQNALATAQLIGDIGIRDEILGHIATGKGRLGNIEGALTAAGMISERIANPLVNLTARDAVLAQIAELQVKVKGDIKGAEDTVGMMKSTDAEMRDQLLNELQRMAAATAAQAEKARRNACITSLNVAEPECRTWLSEIAQVQIQDGNLTDAVAIANMIEETGLRVQVLAEIAGAQIQAGNLKDASTTADSIELASVRQRVRSDIAEAQAEAVTRHLQVGNMQIALATVALIEVPDIRDRTFREIARAQARNGSFDDALATAQSIESHDIQAQARSDIALERSRIATQQLREGNIQAALATAKLMSDVSARDSLLDDIARAQLRIGNLEDALATAGIIESKAVQGQVLVQAVKARIQTGDLQGAFPAAKSIEDARARDQALYAVVQAQPDPQNALAIAVTIAAADIHDQALSAVVTDQLQAGNLENALAAVELMRTPASRERVLSAVTRAQLQFVRTQIEAGNLHDAQTAARQIQDNSAREHLLDQIGTARTQLASQQIQAGNLRDALANAKLIEDASARDGILDAIATTQLQAGNSKDALQTAQLIQEPTAHDKVISRIAQKQLQAGQLEEASSTAKLMQTPGMRDYVYDELARRYIHTQAKDIDKALTVANLIERDSARDTRLYPIAQAKLRAGDIPAALSIAKTMKTNLRDNVFEEVVKFQTQAGQLADALVLTKLIGNENTRHTRLYYIAQAQLQAGDLQGASSTADLMPDGNFRNEILKAVRQSSQ